MILIDEVVWSVYGTVWGYFVSDESFEELYVFACEAGILECGFDNDYYDYPLRRCDDLIVLGAILVIGREFLWRL